MKKLMALTSGLLILGQTLAGFAGQIPPLSFFYVINKIFPEAKDVAIFMTKEMLAENEQKVSRAAASTNVKVKIYVIEGSSSIGNALKQIDPKSVLVIFSSGALDEKSSILYILSKCKEKKILLLTSSRAYSEAGALLGLVYDESENLKLIVNLTYHEELRAKFSQELLQQQGIYADIQ